MGDDGAAAAAEGAARGTRGVAPSHSSPRVFVTLRLTFVLERFDGLGNDRSHFAPAEGDAGALAAWVEHARRRLDDVGEDPYDVTRALQWCGATALAHFADMRDVHGTFQVDYDVAVGHVDTVRAALPWALQRLQAVDYVFALLTADANYVVMHPHPHAAALVLRAAALGFV